ncbi:MAG: DUF2520 domain-containing protein [Myxococcales bacterium]|nr:DUF2520 domain-containing protein [Myxococcales bacterium]
MRPNLARPVLAVLGGSFDPPHMGHVLLPTYLLARGLAARVLVAPCWSHPFAKKLSPFPRRMAMTRRAMAVHGAQVVVSDIERRLGEARSDGRPSYTIELLDALAREHPDYQVRLSFGTDILEGFTRWHAHERIRDEYAPIIVPRAGHGDADPCALPEVSSTAVRGWLATVREGIGDVSEARYRLSHAVPASVLELLDQPAGPALWIVGSGHVATHAHDWLHDRGRETVALRARDFVEADVVLPGARPAGIWVLCRDPALPAVAAGLARALARAGHDGVPTLHGAGAIIARSDAGLAALARAGHPVGTLHPICSVRGELPASRLAEATFGVEGDGPARALALELLSDQPHLDLDDLAPLDRVAYHAACALAANHVAVLLGAARRILEAQGHPRSTVDRALATLLQSSLENLVALKIPRGITGPASRGDAGAIAAHLEALRERDAAAAGLYEALCDRLVALVAGEG